jgi:hypothetical protein
MQSKGIMLVAAFALTACGGLLGRSGSARTYEITTNRSTYARGNTGEATIRNASDDRLEYNLCPRRLERRVGNEWAPAFEWPTAGGACTAEARTLDKGGSVSTLFEIPTGVPSGTYRVIFTGLLGSDKKPLDPDRAATPSFEVR